jgi:hypothetical protein
MYTNGVSHLVVKDDMEGSMAILKWLDFVPKEKNSFNALVPTIHWSASSSANGSSSSSRVPLLDPINRPVIFRPSKAPYDPRLLFTGLKKEEEPSSPPSPSPTSSSSPASSTPLSSSLSSSSFLGGLLDKDSFLELLGGWARSVIVGRGRLGGLPLAVIAVETRSIEQIVPADPAAPDSKEQTVQRAGGVWYPDSAYKTAQAVRDAGEEGLPLLILANWRGFSGGQMDMLQEVLKFGSLIVDALKDYRQPVIIYLPPLATLRGGSWVVLDPAINRRYLSIFADESARGGVLETEGTLDVKFRKPQIIAQIHRLDEKIKEMDKKKAESADASEREQLARAIKQREELLFPSFHSVATLFADLHDTPGRMRAKGCLDGVVEWERSREIIYWKMVRKLKEKESVEKLMCAREGKKGDEGITQRWLDNSIEAEKEWFDCLNQLYSWYQEDKKGATKYEEEEDQTAVAWLMAEGKGSVKERIEKVREEKKKEALIKFIQSNVGNTTGNKAELLSELIKVLNLSPAEKAQLGMK